MSFIGQIWDKSKGIVETIITIGLSTLMVVSLVRYASDFFNSPRFLLFPFDTQESSHKAIEQIRRDIQRAGYSECKNFTRIVKGTDTTLPFQNGILISENSLQTFWLMPLLPATAKLNISPTYNTITIEDSLPLDLKSLQESVVYLGNCIVMEQIQISSAPTDGHSIRLVGTVSNLLINQQTDQLLDNVRLYVLRQSLLQYSEHTQVNSQGIGDNIPALLLNGEVLVSGLDKNGFRVTEDGNGSYDVYLNFDDSLYKGRRALIFQPSTNPGIFEFKVTPRNRNNRGESTPW